MVSECGWTRQALALLDVEGGIAGRAGTLSAILNFVAQQAATLALATSPTSGLLSQYTWGGREGSEEIT